MEALNGVICQENYRRTSSIVARFRQRVGRELNPPLPLFKVLTPLVDNDDDEDKQEESKNNNPPGHAELPVTDLVGVSIARMMLSPLVESDEDEDGDDASSTALGLTADGSNATSVPTTALDPSVDGSDAPPASTTALGSPTDGSNFSEGGDATDAGSVGNEGAPAGNGAMAAPSIPPVQQSTLFQIFL